MIEFEPNRDVHIKVTRRTEYGDRYRLFVIDKKSFENQYSLEDAGITLKNIDGRITVDNLKWNGIAKKMGMETGDVISEFKIENLDRPNKAIIYPFSLIFLFTLFLVLSKSGKQRNPSGLLFSILFQTLYPSL